MGDNLDVVDVGSGVIVESIGEGYLHICSISTSFQIKCWEICDRRRG